MLEAISALDTAVLLFIQEHIRCGALDFIMLFFTRLGDKGAVWLLSGVILFASRQYRKRGFDIIAVVFICGCCSELLKPVFMRPRPFAVMEQMAVLVAAPTTWSFPSGHACAAFAAALAYAKGVKKLAAPAYALAVLISFSRLYVGVHYPSDVLAGAVLGTVLALVLLALSRRFVHIPEYKPEYVTVGGTPEEEKKDESEDQDRIR
ncbi:MAG: phosphatase PAP2 family protein [Oscillospiraceae bacterium]|nr:phosphatase PAP2 family protein [Oscillospiraceae bacterium]